MAWGIRPSEFGLCRPEDDLPIMIAYLDTRTTIEAIETMEASKEIENK